RNFSFARGKLVSAIDTARPYVKRVETVIKPRLHVLSAAPAAYLVPIVSILLALTMFPLAALPFAVALPAAALTCLSLGLALKDGVLILTGYAIALGAAYAFVWLL
ncbi:MAG: exopolysaccharide biosynthesis protein, partial [Pseudomonadota bacterium]